MAASGSHRGYRAPRDAAASRRWRGSASFALLPHNTVADLGVALGDHLIDGRAHEGAAAAGRSPAATVAGADQGTAAVQEGPQLLGCGILGVLVDPGLARLGDISDLHAASL